MRLNQLTYGFVGLGLMGGSLAKAITKYVLAEENSTGKIYAMDKNPSSLEDAILEKTIERGFSERETKEMLSNLVEAERNERRIGLREFIDSESDAIDND